MDKQPPVLILGGIENALAIARSMGRRGIKIYMSVSRNCNALHSKYCTQCFPFSGKNKAQDFWEDLLLHKRYQILDGSVVFPCNDDAVEFVAKHRASLKNDYILDDSVPEISMAMLDKQKTLQMAKSLTIPIPNFWEIESIEDVEKIDSEILFPVIIKPLHSHLFQRLFDGNKFFHANDKEQLLHYLKKCLDKKLKVMICEFIPGPDSLLSGYYSYLDSNGNPLFQFTKKIIRRFPIHHGLACYHRTDWDEEVAEIGLEFLKGINYRGLANVEFKRDLRDGCLKVIECNPRFTAPHELLVQSGMDTALIVYNHLVGLTPPELNSYKKDVRLWFPVRDFLAYINLKQKKEITLWGWLKSVFHKQILPYFKWSDPLPSIVFNVNGVKKLITKKIGAN